MTLIHRMLMAAFLLLQAPSGGPRVSVDLQLDGSFVDVPETFSCVWALDGQPFSRARVDSCLSNILSSPFVEAGTVKVEPPLNSRQRVLFLVRGYSPVVRRVDVHVPKDSGAARWAVTGEPLREGSAYDADSDWDLRRSVVAFYRSAGWQVGISKRLDWYTREKLVDVTYKVYLGARARPQVLMPPFGPPCAQTVGVFDLSGLDDHVPRGLIEDLTETRAFSCFEEAAFERDRFRLLSSEVFETLTFEYSGPKDSRRVVLSGRGRPFHIAAFEVRWHGQGAKDFGVGLELPARRGQKYSRNDVSASIEMIKRMVSSKGLFAEVQESNQVNPGGDLTVVLDVLTVEPDLVAVDGKLYSKQPPKLVAGPK